MFGLFKKFRDGLAKTVSAIAAKTHGLFGGRKIDAASLGELEEALYTADFGVETTGEILAEIKAAHRADPQLQGRQAAELGAAVLTRVLAGSEGRLDLNVGRVPSPGDHRGGGTPPTMQPPVVIALIGVNGSGKTTTAAKLGWLLQQEGRTVTLAACDTFRAAAIEQLKAWAARLNLELIASRTGADAAAVAFDAWQAARARGRDFLLVDTAGRLHTKGNLLEELAKIRRVLQKHDPTAPQHAWLVVDGSLGANSIEQARVFHKSFGLTGLVVTKLDGTSRGGAIVGIWRELRLPIYFLGLGEQAEDLQPFDAANYARAVFGLDAPPGNKQMTELGGQGFASDPGT
jgi:fused signal recognition particle receptor